MSVRVPIKNYLADFSAKGYMYFHQHYFLDYCVRDNVFNTPTKLFLDYRMRAIMFSILPPNYVLYYRVREIMFSIHQPNSFLDYRVREIMFSILPPNEILDYRVREIMFSIHQPNSFLDYRVREITLIVLNVLLWCSLQDKLQFCLTFAENRSLR